MWYWLMDWLSIWLPCRSFYSGALTVAFVSELWQTGSRSIHSTLLQSNPLLCVPAMTGGEFIIGGASVLAGISIGFLGQSILIATGLLITWCYTPWKGFPFMHCNCYYNRCEKQCPGLIQIKELYLIILDFLDCKIILKDLTKIVAASILWKVLHLY